MLTAFSTALSALAAESTAVSVVGNNLANLNTTGYKSSTVSFADLMSQTLSADGSTQLGMGVRQPTTQKNFTEEGAIQSTTNSMSVAINGQGFFIVKTASGATAYTRDGNLKTNAAGVLQTAQGEPIQGWSSLSGNVDTTAAIGDIVVPTGTAEPAVATTSMSVTMNLDGAATPVATPVTPATTPTYTAQSIEVYDSLGESHLVQPKFYFTAPATSTTNAQWAFGYSVDGGPTTISTTTLQFDQQGNLASPASNATSPTMSISGLSDGAQDMNIAFNLYDGTTPTITQYSSLPSSVSSQIQDGLPASQVTGVKVGDDGKVIASLSSGKDMVVGQLALANFANPGSLISIGNNDFTAGTATSGAAIGTANTGGRGGIQGSALEASTVDISTEFTHLMTYQNSYEAASRVISTANSIEQQTINLIGPNG